MKIIYILSDNVYFNSSANIRNIALIKGLQALGHCVTVVSFENGKKRDGEFVSYLSDIKVMSFGSVVEIGNVTAANSATFNKMLKQLKCFLSNIYKYVQIYDPYVRNIRKPELKTIKWDEYDVCITSSDPKSVHLIGKRYLKDFKTKNVKWYQYWGDPMTLDLTVKRTFKSIIHHEENKLFSLADGIIFTNQSCVDAMGDKYPHFRSKMYSISTSMYGVVAMEYQRHPIKDEHICVGYYGGCSKINRNIIPLVDAVKAHSEWRLIQAGGNDIGLITNANITVYDRMGLEQLKELTDGTDVLVVLENLPKKTKSKTPCVQIPGKMYHYGLMGKPVLVICETENIKELFSKYANYYFCNNEKQAIEDTLRRISKDINQNQYLPINDFSPESVAASLIQIINPGC